MVLPDGGCGAPLLPCDSSPHLSPALAANNCPTDLHTFAMADPTQVNRLGEEEEDEEEIDDSVCCKERYANAEADRP